MNVSFTHQSCSLEGNSLELGETREVWNSLTGLYDNLDELLEDDDLKNIPPPHLLSKKPELDVIEIRNHLLATYLLYNKLYKLDHEIDIGEIKRIHRILLKDTPKEIVEVVNRRIQRAGEFRTMQIEAYGFHLTVYPFASEIPALMERFIQFRNECTKNSSFHCLIIACRILSVFLHIHPFVDGNGRLGRSIMALYLIRNGYPPIIFQTIPRFEYASALYQSQAMKDPAPLYSMVLENVFNILMSNQK